MGFIGRAFRAGRRVVRRVAAGLRGGGGHTRAALAGRRVRATVGRIRRRVGRVFARGRRGAR